MNDDLDDKVDYLEAPEIGSIGTTAIEGLKNIERPSAGIGAEIGKVISETKPKQLIPKENTSEALKTVRASLEAESPTVRTSQVAGIPVEVPKIPFDVNADNQANIALMMEDNEKAQRRQQEASSGRKGPLRKAFELTGKFLSLAFQG